MRAARLFLGLSASFAVIASLASGCGSSSSSPPPVDSGAAEDVTMEAAPAEAAVEAAVEAASEAAVDAACVPDASLSSITVPDAGLADSGVNVGECLSCFEGACPNIVATCDQSCVCISAVQTFATCIGTPGSTLLSCAAGLEAIPGVSIQQLACALPCATPCGVSLTGDSGSMTDSATTTDAPAE